VVWGFNGWKKPWGVSPPDTVKASVFETRMKEVGDGLWFAALPTAEQVDWVDVKFADKQFLPKAVDTNDGSNWLIPGIHWVGSQLEELVTVIESAAQAGADVYEYEQVVREANLSLQSADYLKAAAMIVNATEHCMRAESEAWIQSAEGAYEEAVQEGLVIRRAEIFMSAARAQLEMGNYHGSSTYSQQVLALVDEARAEVGEGGLLGMVVLTLLALSSRSWVPKGRLKREH
jgi:hypothetical protein